MSFKYHRFYINNRWKRKKYSRNSDWVIIGIQQSWVSPVEFYYKLCLFGIDLILWFKEDSQENDPKP